MKQDYIIYKGKRYNSGDTIQILWCANGYKNARNYTGIFIDCDEAKDEYRFVVDNKMYCFNKTCFFKIIRNNLSIEKNIACINNESKKITLKDELCVDGMLIAWMWYIFIMAVAIIFKDCIGIWIIVSFIFLRYRNRKLREVGYKK